MKKYIKYCGTRCFIFQCCLLIWTTLMLILLVALVSDTITETEHYVNIREMSPKDAEAEVGASACCPFGLWFIVAFPLFIAAIMTFKKG